MFLKKKTTKEEMVRKIFSEVIKKDKTAKRPEMFYNLEGDWVIQYQQGRQKYLVMIEELFDL